MKTSPDLISHILKEIDLRISNAKFRYFTFFYSEQELRGRIGKKLTARELGKIKDTLLISYPQVAARQETGMSKSFNFEDLAVPYKCRYSASFDVAAYGEVLFTEKLLADLQEKQKQSDSYLKELEALRLNAHDLIDLEDKFQAELEDLKARHQKERDLFKVQCKCPLDDLEGPKKAATETLREEKRNAEWKARESLIGARP
jgi:hypothetical protein